MGISGCPGDATGSSCCAYADLYVSMCQLRTWQSHGDSPEVPAAELTRLHPTKTLANSL